jgi:hypothetical protein
MNTKLTLKLDKSVIQKAKKFAKNNHISLSSLVERYFESITKGEKSKQSSLTPTVKALAGTLKLNNKTKPDDLRDQYLLEKYLNE